MDLDRAAIEGLKSDLLTMETFLNAQGLPWLSHQAKLAFRILIRADVQKLLCDGDSRSDA